MIVPHAPGLRESHINNTRNTRETQTRYVSTKIKLRDAGCASQSGKYAPGTLERFIRGRPRSNLHPRSPTGDLSAVRHRSTDRARCKGTRQATGRKAKHAPFVRKSGSATQDSTSHIPNTQIACTRKRSPTCFHPSYARKAHRDRPVYSLNGLTLSPQRERRRFYSGNACEG